MPGATTTAPTTAPVTGTTGTAAGAPSPAPAPGNPLTMMLPVILLMFGGMWWMNRKEKKKREELMSAVKRGDRVMLTSGMMGYVVDLTNDEVVIRMEEGKARFNRSAIQAVVNPTKAATGAEVKEAGKTVGAA